MSRKFAAFVLLTVHCIAQNVQVPGDYMGPYASDKTHYIIGGWDPNQSMKDFLDSFQPIFQDYLTETVGPLFDPPISFELVPTDWPQLGDDDSITSETMMESGELDFVCTFPYLLVIIMND